MMKKIVFLILICFQLNAFAQTKIDSLYTETEIILETKTGTLYGTLCLPEIQNNISVALIIAGSGPTDCNGNNPMMKNNSLKYLAQELVKKGIASVRYDKRGIGKSKIENLNESDIRFDDFVNDASDWISLLKKDTRFSKVIVIGHSEGSLIGMIAAKEKTDKFVSLAGAGDSADVILKKQLALQPQYIKDMTTPILDSLKNGHLVKNANPILNSLFRKDIQPYLISWFKYNPQKEIKKLNIPILLINGTKDIQVPENEAEKLKNAQPNSELVLIENMNHVLKIVEVNGISNLESYNKPEIPVAEELIKAIANFIFK